MTPDDRVGRIDDRYDYHTHEVQPGDDLDALARRMEADGWEFSAVLMEPRRLRFRRLRKPTGP